MLTIEAERKTRSVGRTMTTYFIFILSFIQGHEFLPMLFVVDATGKISFAAKLDAAVQKEAEAMSAMAKFRSMDKQALGTSSSKSVSTHLNAIKYVGICFPSFFDVLSLTIENFRT